MGYDYVELAEALGKPTPDAARKAVQRAVVRLAEEIHRARGCTTSSTSWPRRSSTARPSTGRTPTR